MSLGQLTANYTDSEGDDDDHMSDDTSHKSSPMGVTRISELREEGSRRGTPFSIESGGSGTNTPQKKLSRLVSYANEDDEDGEDIDRDGEEEEPDDILNSEPMDTGTDEGEDDKTKLKTHGVKLPAPPPGKCPQHLQDKVNRCLNEVQRGNKDYNAKIQNNKEFRNPGIYEKLIDLLQLDEMGTNYPLVDIISGTKKPLEEEAKKRKSRFDQGGPSSNIIKPMVAPPTLTSVPSGTKATIDAFGSLKKTK
ncbi:SAP30-binding protein-like isoform X2 [Homarus americanus]|uniref:SAP30-binding protein-like isoform X2 n=1 Tax=Homarus americanus TaxID=6706 RepID=UPI001C483E8E|nr:SAP30-binding protein-like isoform X2 [Homarus americanus]